MENLKNIWKPERKSFSDNEIMFTYNLLNKHCIAVYRIQLEAPTPKRIPCDNCPDRPEFYGKEYHGIMGHKEATSLLENEPNGAFLIRKGNQFNDFYTLTWR